VDKRLLAALAVAVVAPAAVSRAQLVPPPAASCLHEAAERQPDRLRRDEAIALAKAVHERQALLARQSRRYHQLSELQPLPGTPAGFEMRLFADSSGYVLSLKDVTDPCHFAVFSDQAGLLYQKSALSAPVVAQVR
jgi:hypothetical protein